MKDHDPTKKTDNHPAARAAKIEIRRHLLQAISPARVFDAFAGAGQLHDAVWHGAAEYVGCDEKWFRDQRTMFVADNRRVLRAIDLTRFNIFDLDAYGSPWEQALIIAARRPLQPQERIAFAITEGLGFQYKHNAMTAPVALLARLKPGVQVGLNRREDTIIDRCLIGLAQRMGAKLVRQWRAEGRTGASVRYLGIVLEQVNDAAERAAGSDSPAADTAANLS